MIKYILNIIPLSFILIVTIIWCSSPTEPHEENEFLGQIKSDLNTAVLKPDGTVWTCGPNITGQLGIGSLEQKLNLVQIPTLKGVVSIDLYGGMAVASDKEGNIWFWGENLYRPALPPTQVVSPIKISCLEGVKYINICGDYIHLLKKDGTVWRISPDYNLPTEFISSEKLSGLNGIYSISQTLALRYDGTIREIIHTEPEYGGLISGIKDVVALQNVWNRRTLILKKDGTVWAWGQNGIGQLGNGTFEASAIPMKVKDLTDVIEISANYDFNLALKNDRTVWFWGFKGNWDDNHTPVGINSPVKIENLEDIVLIYADHPCYLVKTDGSVWYYLQSNNTLEQLLYDQINS